MLRNNMYHHIAHLDTFAPGITIGARIQRGQLIGYCGKSGTTSPHCHYEIMKEKPKKWTGYTWGMTKQQVKDLYPDPTPYITELLPMKWNSLGYDYLTPITSGESKGWHPGKDLNWGSGSADFRFPAYATCDGVVEYMGFNPNDGSWGNNIWWREEKNPVANLDNHFIQETQVSGQFALVYGGYKHLITDARAGLAALTIQARSMPYKAVDKATFDLIPTGNNF